MACQHEDFVAHVEINRLHNAPDEHESCEVSSFAFDLRVQCAECGADFGFRGVPCGVAINGSPMRSVDALELRGTLLTPTQLALCDGPPGMVAP